MSGQSESGSSSLGPRLALLVGNGSFRGGLSPLPGAIRDVSALHLQLSSGGMGYETAHVKLAIEADLATLSQSVDQLCKDAERLNAASVLIYISTHGLYHKDQYHLCVADSLIGGDAAEQTLPLETLREWLAPLQKRTQILLLDSCRTREQNNPYASPLISKDGGAMLQFPASFAALSGGRPAPVDVEVPAIVAQVAQAARREDLYLEGENWAILTSASNGEMAWLERATASPFQDGPHSIFTRALLDTLAATHGASALDVVSLHEQVSALVQQQVSSFRQGISQTPSLMMQCQTRPIVAERVLDPGAQGEPFQHLDAFSRHDAHRFFGREGDIALAIGAEHSAGSTGGWLFSKRRHHVLSAPSGAGKTSFLQAGLQPRLERQGHLVFRVDCRVPHALFKELFAYLGDTEEADLPMLLARCQEGRAGEVILLLDQFESLFLDISLQKSWEVLAQQLDVLAQHPQNLRYRLLIALREDCVGQLLNPPTFAGELPSETFLDMSDSILAADMEPVTKTSLDMSDSILSTKSTQIGGEASESSLDMSDSILSTKSTQVGGEASESSLDMSDSILSAATKAPTEGIADTLLGMPDAVDALEPAIDEPGEGPRGSHVGKPSRVATPSVVDLLALDNEQWHALPFLQFAQAREAIHQPLKGHTVQFSDDLIFALLRDLHQHSLHAVDAQPRAQVVYPPYLQIACHTLYEEATRQGWKEVQLSHYEQMGSLDTLLRKYLQTTLQGERGRHRLDAKAQVHAWYLLKALVSQEGRRLSLGQGQLEEQLSRRGISNEQVRASLEALSGRRLLTCVSIQEQPFWSLTHDLLCLQVLEEIEQDPKELALRQAHRSLEHLRDERRLAQQKQLPLPWLELERAQPLADASDEIALRIAHPTAGVSSSGWQEGEFAEVTAFVEESIKAGLREQEQQDAQRKEREALLLEREQLLTHRSRLISWGLGGLSLLLVALSGVGFWANQQQTRATSAQKKATNAKKKLDKAVLETQRLTSEALTSQRQAAARRDALLAEIKRSKEGREYDQARALLEMGRTFSKGPLFFRKSERDRPFFRALRMFQTAYGLAVKQKKRKLQAKLLFEMGLAHSEIKQERPKHIRLSLEAYKKALLLIKRKETPLFWAKIKVGMGVSHKRSFAPRHVRLRKAISLYQEALTVLTKQKHPTEWASAHNNLGNAWLHMKRKPAQELPRAIRQYRATLEVDTRAKHPMRWAIATHNLALASSMLHVKRAAEQHKAIALYKRTLEVKTFHKYPLRWASTMRGIADAYTRLGDINPTYAKEAAVYYKQALRVFSPRRQPSEWTHALALIARLYERHAIFGKRSVRLPRAIRLYRKILKTTGDRIRPTAKASIYYKMGVAYGRFPGKGAAKWYPTIAAYQKAVDIFTKSTSPRSWRMAIENLIIANWRLHSQLKGAEKERSRLKLLRLLHDLIQARYKWKQTRGLTGFRMVYVSLLKGKALLLKGLLTMQKESGNTAAWAMRIAESALHNNRPKLALHWLHKAPAKKRPDLRLWQLHLAWQIGLYLPTFSAKKRQGLCLRFLTHYKRLRVRSWKRLDFSATTQFLKRNPSPQSTQIQRSMVLFQGPFSASAALAQTQRCQSKKP